MTVDLPRMTVAWNLRIVPCFTKQDPNTVDPRCYSVPFLPRSNRNLVRTYVCMVTHIPSKSMEQPGKDANPARGHLISVLYVFFLSILDVKFVWVYQPESHRRKVTQDFSSALFLRCMPLFLARKIQPFLSLGDREVENCALTI